MTKIAVVDKQPSKVDYQKYFKFDSSIDLEVFHLSPVRVKKLLKRDVTLELDPDEYDFVILVGSDAMKFFTKLTAVTTYSGHLVDDKFIPIIDPAMLVFKPEVAPLWDDSVDKINSYINGDFLVKETGEYRGIQDEKEAEEHLQFLLDNAKVVALDSETSSLYVRDGCLLGISLSYKENEGVYIDADFLSEKAVALLQKIVDTKIIVMHNKKFDMVWYGYHLGIRFTNIVEDTMIMHYVLDEQPGTHGLKQLCIKYTDLGDYDRDLDTFKKDYCRQHKVLQADFSYDLIPFDVMWPYAAKDTAGTLALYNKFLPIIKKNPKLHGVYRDILRPGSDFLMDLQENGVPFDVDRLKSAQTYLEGKLEHFKTTLYSYQEVHAFEQAQEKQFNPQSPIQLRKLLFDFLGLIPTGKKTDTGADSTDVEVLTQLSKVHEIPGLILQIRKTQKLLNTYVLKIIPALDRDGRLRTNFNLVFTTSGRLSSSGKLNMQQIPRDDPLIKGCIRARPGYKIVAMDLGTAEMYYAAVLSKDKNLMAIFQEGGDFHSAIAKMVFKLPCSVDEVKKKFGGYRQAAKAISFGILYGSGPNKVASTVNEFRLEESVKTGEKYIPYTLMDAKDDIATYFETYPALEKWIKRSQKAIKTDGFIYSFFGRKRRLPNVFSENQAIAAGEVRSGLNFLIQSVASDVNLLGAMDTFRELSLSEVDGALMFALVHDSILAEVREDKIDEYVEILTAAVQKDRGINIPGAPIKLDIDIADDYSLGKYEEMYTDEELNRYSVSDIPTEAA